MFCVVYLGIFATAIGFLFQSIGVKNTNSSSAALILSLEAVFGIIFSIIVYNEQITTKLATGFVFISIAVIVSETKLNFLRKIEETCTEDND